MSKKKNRNIPSIMFTGNDKRFISSVKKAMKKSPPKIDIPAETERIKRENRELVPA